MERLQFAIPIILTRTGEPITKATINHELQRAADERAFVNAINKGPVVDKDATEDAITRLSRHRAPGMSSQHSRSFGEVVAKYVNNFYGGDIIQQSASSIALRSMSRGMPKTRG